MSKAASKTLNGIRVRALMPVTNTENDRQYKTGEEFVMYRPAEKVRELMQMCLIEILDGEESPAVVVSEDTNNGNIG
jgi:hypothetical protein